MFIIYLTDFRVNKYCGELLQIGNENYDVRKNINWTELVKDDEDDEELNGPRTAALRHDMNFYKFTNVKIITPDKNESQIETPQANVEKLKITRPVEKERKKLKSEVYSQVI